MTVGELTHIQVFVTAELVVVILQYSSIIMLGKWVYVLCGKDVWPRNITYIYNNNDDANTVQANKQKERQDK